MKVLPARAAVALIAFAFIAAAPAQETSQSDKTAHANTSQPIFKNYADLKWDKILPDLGAASPEICILQVDPATKATKLLIRTPKAMHVRKHWHSANETHTVILGTQSTL